MGDIDGRLFSGIRLLDAPALDGLNPALFNAVKDDSGKIVGHTPVTSTYFTEEAEFAFFDRHGTEANPQYWMRPNKLLQGWYDQAQWQDIGKTPIINQYPLGGKKPNPKFEDRSTWRDNWLEYAIVY